jgi:hypothetical protein
LDLKYVGWQDRQCILSGFAKRSAASSFTDGVEQTDPTKSENIFTTEPLEKDSAGLMLVNP